MRYMGGCTECFTVWWGCRCPLRCEECGCGYQDNGNSTCNTPGCVTGRNRAFAIMAGWERQREAERVEREAEIRCEPGEPAPVKPEDQGGNGSLPPLTTKPERGAHSATPTPAPRRASVRNQQVRKPTARSTSRPPSRPDKPAHRPVAERRAAVEALLAEGLSDREIARRAGVSPSTVSAVRKGQEASRIGA